MENVDIYSMNSKMPVTIFFQDVAKLIAGY